MPEILGCAAHQKVNLKHCIFANECCGSAHLAEEYY